MLNLRWMIIKDPGVVLPSDLSGVLYEPRERWRTAILRELRDAGIPVDPHATA
jgi:hypothetical protein